MTPQDALNYAKRFIGDAPLDDANLRFRVLDAANKHLWFIEPWRWTVGALEVVTLSNSVQDYVLQTPPADLFSLLTAKLVHDDQIHDLSVTAVLPQTTAILGRPTQVAYVSGSLRVLPVPTGYTSVMPRVVALYKKKAPVIDAGNINTNLSTTTGMPDDWFHVYEELVLLKAFQFMSSPRYAQQQQAVDRLIQIMLLTEPKIFNTVGAPVSNHV